MPKYRRVLRPATEEYAQHLAQSCRLDGPPLRITSAVRTIEVQKRITLNAAPPSGPASSLHVRGTAFDIAQQGLTRRQRACIEREAIKRERAAGAARFDVIKERHRHARCYHFSVLECPRHPKQGQTTSHLARSAARAESARFATR
jgi:hypothetical protein